MQSASQASIPPSLIVCIEFVESSGGKYYDAETNNPLGWQNGKASFPSVRAAIRHVSQRTRLRTLVRGQNARRKTPRLQSPPLLRRESARLHEPASLSRIV